MSELLHRLHTKHMWVEVYRDRVLLCSQYHVVKMPPRRIRDIRVQPMGWLRDGRLEISAYFPRHVKPIPFAITLLPDRNKEEIAKRLADTVQRLMAEGAGAGVEAEILYHILLTETGKELVDSLADGTELTLDVVHRSFGPTLRVSHHNKTLGYLPKTRFTAPFLKMVRKGGLRMEVRNGKFRQLPPDAPRSCELLEPKEEDAGSK